MYTRRFFFSQDGENGLYPPLFVALVFGNWSQYRDSDFEKFISDDLATIFVNLVNFGPVVGLTPEFTKMKIYTRRFFKKIF